MNSDGKVWWTSGNPEFSAFVLLISTVNMSIDPARYRYSFMKYIVFIRRNVQKIWTRRIITEDVA